MKIDKNTIIKCKTRQEVVDCLNRLRDLGFKSDLNPANSNGLLVTSYDGPEFFTNFYNINVKEDCFFLNYNNFLKLYNKQIKKIKQSDLLVDKNGKVLKVNNWNSNKQLYWNNNIITSPLNEWIEDSKNCFYEDDYYISKETCEKAQKRKEIENKLRALAFELNGNKDIDWNNKLTNKYCITYCNDIIEQERWSTIKYQGTIYCYSKDFLHKAIELINEEDLKDYLINC